MAVVELFSGHRVTDLPISLRQFRSVYVESSFFRWRDLNQAKSSAQWFVLLVTLTREHR